MTQGATAEEAQDILQRCREDPVFFIEEVLGDRGWPVQYEIIESVRDNRNTAVKSCHSIGKDWISSRAVLWFYACFDHSLVLTTGPTQRQVKGILWRELAKAASRSRHPLGFKPLKTEMRDDEGDKLAVGFTTTDDAEKAAGFHAAHVLVIVDEASGVKPNMYESIQAALTSEHVHFLEIGNPTDPTGPFATSFKTPGVNKISVTAFQTPNFTTFNITQQDIEEDTWRAKITGPMPHPYLITPHWVADRFNRWGGGSPWYKSRILAEFPESGEDTLIPMSWIEAAQDRDLEPGRPDVLGVDIARFGPDFNVVAHRRGPVMRIRDRWQGLDTTQTTGRIIRHLKDSTATVANVDEAGIGAGVVDSLREQKQRVMGVNAAGSPIEEDRFINARAEMFWNLREELEAGRMDFDRADEDLASQLASMKYKHTSKGKIQIESKDDMKRRGLKSPDDADAAAHTFCGEAKFLTKYQKAMSNI